MKLVLKMFKTYERENIVEINFACDTRRTTEREREREKERENIIKINLECNIGRMIKKMLIKMSTA